MIDVHCPTCHRLERWSDGRVAEVVTPGGARRPAGPTLLSTWEVLEASLAAGGPRVVARCEACGQPMTAPAGAELPRIRWTLELPAAGTVHLEPEGVLRQTEGAALSAGDVRRELLALERPWYRTLKPGLGLFQALLLGSVTVPLGAFAFGVLVLSIFFLPAAQQWLELGSSLLGWFL